MDALLNYSLCAFCAFLWLKILVPFVAYSGFAFLRGSGAILGPMPGPSLTV